MNAARLQRIATDTGGQFYKASAASALPEDMRYSGRGVTTTEERDLWHMPIWISLVVIVGTLLVAAWASRKWPKDEDPSSDGGHPGAPTPAAAA